MNAKDMLIQPTEEGFIVSYRCGIIHKAVVNCNIGIIHFQLVDGCSYMIDVSAHVEMSKAYNSQFGITLSDDGRLFFVQSWEAGLFCFNTQTGELQWHNKQKKAYQLATKGDTVLCRYSGKCISVIDVQTGVAFRNYPLAAATVFEPLSREYYLAGPKRGYYDVLDSNLDRKAKVLAMELNPNGMDSFIIQDAVLIENCIVISGVEYTTKEFLSSVKAHQSDEFIDRSRFVRHIPICMELI